MRTWRDTGIISTMRRTRSWDCRWGVGWSRVRVSGLSNSASRAWGCAGVRTAFTICYISDSPGSTARLRRCFRYSSNHPPTRNYARSRPCSRRRHDLTHTEKGEIEVVDTIGPQGRLPPAPVSQLAILSGTHAFDIHIFAEETPLVLRPASSQRQ